MLATRAHVACAAALVLVGARTRAAEAREPGRLGAYARAVGTEEVCWPTARTIPELVPGESVRISVRSRCEFRPLYRVAERTARRHLSQARRER